VFSKYQCPAANPLLPIYKTLALEILAGSKDDEIAALREVLQKLVDNLALNLDENHPIYWEFYEYSFITHLLMMKSECARGSSL